MAIVTDPVAFANTSFDYIVAGGGTAGLTLAARLTENLNIVVGVIEAGLDRTEDPNVLIPGLTPTMWDNPDYDWIFQTVPQTYGNNRVVNHPRGKQLGGSSAINFLYSTHASQRDIDGWGELGNPGWSWSELFPYFLKSEKYNAPSASISAQVDTTFIEPSLHGEHGPVQNSFPPFYDNFYKAWEPTYKNLGLGPTGDPKGGIAIGAYTTLLSLDATNATRSYAGNAYYKPNAGRPNLMVLTGAFATKIVFAASKTPLVATGVSFTFSGEVYTASARREVIICAGTFQAPHLLELSGIGNASLLKSKGIDLRLDNPNVGENLQDHILLPLAFEAAPGEVTFESLRNETYSTDALAEYTVNHTGPLAAGTCNAYISFGQVLDALKKGQSHLLSSLRQKTSIIKALDKNTHSIQDPSLSLFSAYHLTAKSRANQRNMHLSSKSYSTPKKQACKKSIFPPGLFHNMPITPVSSTAQMLPITQATISPCSPSSSTLYLMAAYISYPQILLSTQPSIQTTYLIL